MELWFLHQSLLFQLQEEDEEEDGEEDEEDEAEEGELRLNKAISCRAVSVVTYLVFLELPKPQCRAVVAAAGSEQCHHHGSHRERAFRSS